MIRTFTCLISPNVKQLPVCFLQDFVIYLLSGTTTILGCCKEHCNGEDEERLKVDILLFAPDVLPQHCCVKRLDSNNHTPTGEHRKTQTMLKPLHGAPVTRNGSFLKGEVELNPGDLVGLGKHYLFMFKDPTSTSASLQTPLWMTRLCPNGDLKATSACLSCGSSVATKRVQRRTVPPRWRDLEGTEALIVYELDQEERVLQEILNMLDPSGKEPKLTPAFLLSLCIQHSASAFELTHLRQLLLRIASQIQLIMWVREEVCSLFLTKLKGVSSVLVTNPSNGFFLHCMCLGEDKGARNNPARNVSRLAAVCQKCMTRSSCCLGLYMMADSKCHCLNKRSVRDPDLLLHASSENKEVS